MPSIVDNPFVFIDPAERATVEDKAKAFEWLRSVAVKDVGSPESESAAVMMLEVIRLTGAQSLPVPPLPKDARIRRGYEGGHVREGGVIRDSLAAKLSRPEARITRAGETAPVSTPDSSVPTEKPIIWRE